MPKMIISIPEGDTCHGCPIDRNWNKNGDYCTAFKKNNYVGHSDKKWDIRTLKCPACKIACQQYRDEHDDEKAERILMDFANKVVTQAKARQIIDLTGPMAEALKALHYKKGAK